MEEEDFLTPEIMESPDKTRPVLITIICIVGFLEAAYTLKYIFTTSPLHTVYQIIFGAEAIIGFICFSGLWKMKKWSVYLYIGFTAVYLIVMLLLGYWSIYPLIMPVLYIATMLAYFNRMD
jgi:uncharacterized membrane protein (DUF2068 family)